jgi:hypothetical protein
LLINGGVVVAIQQIEKDEGSDFASVSKYVTALDDLVKPLTGGLRPNIIVPLEGRSTDFFRLLGIHCDIQSSIRYRQERTALFGLTPSVTPTAAESDRAVSCRRFLPGGCPSWLRSQSEP